MQLVFLAVKERRRSTPFSTGTGESGTPTIQI
jgi:hypothetical protein